MINTLRKTYQVSFIGFNGERLVFIDSEFPMLDEDTSNIVIDRAIVEGNAVYGEDFRDVIDSYEIVVQ